MTLLLVTSLPLQSQAYAALENREGTNLSILNRPARLAVADVALDEALVRLSHSSGVPVAFSPTLLEGEFRRVSCDCAGATVSQALSRLLAGTHIEHKVVAGQVVLTPASASPARPLDALAQRRVFARLDDSPSAGHRPGVDLVTPAPTAAGTIVGRVTDAATGQGISGVSIVVEGTSHSARTGAGGEYRVSGVPAGRHTLVALMLGYARQAREVTVGDGATTEVAFALVRAAIAMDEMVVTGAMVETRVRELPAPITVITAEDIERLGIQRPDQLFRGAVAGGVTFDPGPINHYANVSVRGTNSLSGDFIKTYIDGVEITDPLFVTTIDPASIERIEILRGPQASTIYGSGASGGVMQIFTKKGRSGNRPTIALKTAAGHVDGRWNDGSAVAQTDNSVAVSGGSDEYTYNLGATHVWNGAYVPGGDSRNASLFGSMHFEQGPLRADLSGRWYRKSFGRPLNPIMIDAGFSTRTEPDQSETLGQKSIGLNVAYQATPAWTHNLTLGYDATKYDYHTFRQALSTPADTFYMVSFTASDRISARYNTSLRLDLTSAVSTTLLAGIDHNEFSAGNYSTFQAASHSGSIGTTMASLSRNEWGNTGYFAQAQTGFGDRLFLTTGLRIEDNDNLGEEYGRAVAPRVGVAYSFALGGIEAKARGAWGKGIRAPLPGHKVGEVSPYYTILPNAGIGPEEVAGWDAGLELAFSDRATLGITYYDQTADGLIEAVQFGGDDPAARLVYQYQNVGKIGNSGWELEGELFLQPLPITLRGTFTTMKSIMEERAPGYDGDIQIGERMMSIPEYSGGLTATYAYSRGTLSLSATHLGPWRNYDLMALYGHYYNGDAYRGSMREYWRDYDGVTKYGLNATYAISGTLQTFLSVANLTNNTGNERDNTSIDTPRSMLFGLRYSY